MEMDRGDLLDRFQEVEKKIKGAASTLNLLAIAANDRSMSSDWMLALERLSDDLLAAQSINREIKGAVLPTPKAVLKIQKTG